MPRPADKLNSLSTTSQCSADWDSMVGNDRVRFCTHCSLSVHNVSAMTRKEAVELVRKSGGRLCLRLVRRPDGSVLTAPPPRRLHAIQRRASRVAAGTFSAALSIYVSASAQAPIHGQLPQGGSEQALQVSSTRSEDASGLSATLVGTVFDPMGAVIAGAAVTLVNEDTGQERTTVSNDEGVYKFQFLEAASYTLKVESPGFSPSEVHVKLGDGGEQRANSTLEVAGPQEVVDVVMEVNVTTVTMGVVAVVEPSEPLVKAAFKDDIAAVKELLAFGADVNTLDENTGTTALMEAVRNGNREMVRELIGAGAAVNARNGHGTTALMMTDGDGSAALVWDLVSAGAKVNLRDDEGNTALMGAASHKRTDVVQALIHAGAKVNARNREGQTALVMAAQGGVVGNVRALAAAGADVNKRDNDGWTALKYAKDGEHAGVVELLLACGAVEDER